MASIPTDPPRVLEPPTPFYPESDGKPLGETGVHVLAIFRLYELLHNLFKGRQDVAIHADMFLYYLEGKPRVSVCPDVFVAIGPRFFPNRRVYKVWEEGKAPDVVFEVTSASTYHEDLHRKLEIYRDALEVTEYFLFDPLEERLDPPLVGFRLDNGEYEPIEPVAGRLPSQVLGVHLERDGQYVRLYDPAAGRHILTDEDRAEAAREEADAARERAEAAREEAEAAQAALRERDAQLEQLRRELDALRRRTAPGS